MQAREVWRSDELDLDSFLHILSVVFQFITRKISTLHRHLTSLSPILESLQDAFRPI